MILIKNTIWNHTIRYWELLRYYLYGYNKGMWAGYFYPYKKPYTLKQLKQLNEELQEAFDKFMQEEI